MGKLKTVGIVLGVIVGLFIVASLASGLSYSMKYDGLTDKQISGIERIKEACDNQAALASIQSSEAGERIAQKCEEVEAKKIAEYRAQNTAN